MSIASPIKPDVTYKQICGFTGYRAGTDGSIWSCWRMCGSGYGGVVKQVLSDKWKQLKPEHRKEDGRKRYTLKSDDGSYVRRYGSYFILITYSGERPVGMEACHCDGNCLNDSPSNLRWDTPVANKADMAAHGTKCFGETIGNSKLKERDIPTIRDRRTNGESLKRIAADYSVTPALISMIAKKRIWKHV